MNLRTHVMALLLPMLAGCAHVASNSGTFTRLGQGAGNLFVLDLERHVDTIVNGPDIEEDQYLRLEILRYELNQRITLPSDAVAARLAIKRFGPSSEGRDFQGTITIKSVAAEQVVAKLDLKVQALTADGSYKQVVKFDGQFTFYQRASHE